MKEQKKQRRNTVLCLHNRFFFLRSDIIGKSLHLAHRKIDWQQNNSANYAFWSCSSSENHHQPCSLLKASFFALTLVHVPFFSPAQVYNDISTGGVFEEGGLDRKHIFLTIHDAVLFALANIKEVVHPPILEEVRLLSICFLSTSQYCTVKSIRCASTKEEQNLTNAHSKLSCLS